MMKRTAVILTLSLVFCVLVAAPLPAADLQVQVQDNGMTITNLLPAAVYVMTLNGSGATVHVNKKIDAGASVTIQAKGGSFDSATCSMIGAAPAGLAKDSAGRYLLSVK